MKPKSYTISSVTETELKELKEKMGATSSELVRRAIHEMWVKEVKKGR